MTTVAEVSLGDILWRQIKPFKEELDIYESPSVSMVVVPESLESFIETAMKKMLRASVERGSRRARIYCFVTDLRYLVLGVADDGDKSDVVSQSVVTWISGQAFAMITERKGEKITQLSLALPLD